MTPSALGCRLGEWNRGTAQAGWSVGISSTSGGSNSLFFYFLTTCGQGLFAGPASSQAALLALPQLALCCSLAACPLPWQCPLLLYALEYPDMLPQGMPRAGHMLFLRAGAQMHHSSPPLPACRLSHELGGDGVVFHLHTSILGGAGTVLTLHSSDALGCGSSHCPPATMLPLLRTTLKQGTGVPALPGNTCSLQVVWM